MKLYVAIIVILIFIIILEFIKKKQYFTNFIKNTDIIDNINIKDSIIYIGSNPKDPCIKRNSIATCLVDKKCRIRERINPNNSQETIKECVSSNDINVEKDLIVNNYLELGTGMYKRKIDINTLRRIKNLPIHFNKTSNINNSQETICLTNGSLDLPRCVQTEGGKFYIKLRGKDETSDHGYNATKDCKYTAVSDGNKTGIHQTDINTTTNEFNSLNACNTYLKNNYNDNNNIKSANTANNNSCLAGSNPSNAVTKTDTNYSCIQKHHIEMLNGHRPIGLRTFASISPFTFFRKRFNEPPYMVRGLDDNKDFDVSPPTKKGPMSVNIHKKYKLIAYSQPNYGGVSKTYRYPGVKDVSGDMPNGIRSYKVRHDDVPASKLKHVCLTRANEFENAPSWNASKKKTNVYTPEPCSYDNKYQMFYMEFDKDILRSDGHEHPHYHNNDKVHE